MADQLDSFFVVTSEALIHVNPNPFKMDRVGAPCVEVRARCRAREIVSEQDAGIFPRLAAPSLSSGSQRSLEDAFPLVGITPTRVGIYVPRLISCGEQMFQNRIQQPDEASDEQWGGWEGPLFAMFTEEEKAENCFEHLCRPRAQMCSDALKQRWIHETRQVLRAIRNSGERVVRLSGDMERRWSWRSA